MSSGGIFGTWALTQKILQISDLEDLSFQRLELFGPELHSIAQKPELAPSSSVRRREQAKHRLQGILPNVSFHKRRNDNPNCWRQSPVVYLIVLQRRGTSELSVPGWGLGCWTFPLYRWRSRCPVLKPIGFGVMNPVSFGGWFSCDVASGPMSCNGSSFMLRTLFN